MDLYAVFGRSNGMDARYAVNGGGNRKSRCQNGTLLSFDELTNMA